MKLWKAGVFDGQSNDLLQVGNSGTDYHFYMHPMVAGLERMSRLFMRYK